jgi:uncharacterized protein (DUF2147 family)
MRITLLALVVAVQAHAAGVSGAVAGLWKPPGDDGLIRIEACGEAICGRIASAAPTANAPAQQGILIMKLKPTGPDRWGDGWITDPDNGRRYKATVALTRDGQLRLKGCLVAPLCRTQTWTRVDVVAGRVQTAPPPY